MNPQSAQPARPLPRSLSFLAGAAVAFHLTAIVLLVLSAPSGPWITNFGPSPALGPAFATSMGEDLTRNYLRPLKMTHNYHFSRNRSEMPTVYFEVQLADENGKPLRTLRYPDPSANFWVRHRQSLIALALGDDQPVQPPQGETIPAPNQKVPMVEIWDMGKDGKTMELHQVAQHLVPRDRPIVRPSEWSQIVARSALRYQLRTHGAASARLIRHSRDAVMPALLFMPEPPRETFNEMIADFGEVKP